MPSSAPATGNRLPQETNKLTRLLLCHHSKLIGADSPPQRQHREDLMIRADSFVATRSSDFRRISIVNEQSNVPCSSHVSAGLRANPPCFPKLGPSQPVQP